MHVMHARYRFGQMIFYVAQVIGRILGWEVASYACIYVCIYACMHGTVHPNLSRCAVRMVRPAILQMCGANGAPNSSPDVRCEWCIHEFSRCAVRMVHPNCEINRLQWPYFTPR